MGRKSEREREGDCSLAYQEEARNGKKRRPLCAMPDTFHNLCVCISLGVAKRGRGRGPKVYRCGKKERVGQRSTASERGRGKKLRINETEN